MIETFINGLHIAFSALVISFFHSRPRTLRALVIRVRRSHGLVAALFCECVFIASVTFVFLFLVLFGLMSFGEVFQCVS